MRHNEYKILLKKESGRIRVDPRPARRVVTIDFQEAVA